MTQVGCFGLLGVEDWDLHWYVVLVAPSGPLQLLVSDGAVDELLSCTTVQNQDAIVGLQESQNCKWRGIACTHLRPKRFRVIGNLYGAFPKEFMQSLGANTLLGRHQGRHATRKQTHSALN